MILSKKIRRTFFRSISYEFYVALKLIAIHALTAPIICHFPSKWLLAPSASDNNDNATMHTVYFTRRRFVTSPKSEYEASLHLIKWIRGHGSHAGNLSQVSNWNMRKVMFPHLLYWSFFIVGWKVIGLWQIPQSSYSKLALLPHSVWKFLKKSHSILRAKRATFTTWVEKSS